jgi:putative transposase
VLTISRNSPCLYVTAVTNNRLPVFRTDRFKALACLALDEARKSAGFRLFAYVIMPDHLHVITDGARTPADTLRFIKGIVSHRVIEFLKENGYESSLKKIRHESQTRNYRYSLWQHHSDLKLLTSEGFFMQRVGYIHQNPVRLGLVEKPVDYRWSSARLWAGCPGEDEPLAVDIASVQWRSAKA